MIADVERAVARAVSFLERNQLASGELRVLTSTHPEMAGDCAVDSAVFPTALAVQALAKVPAAAALRDRALDFLLDEMDGLGLSRHWARAHPQYTALPPDLDDTSAVSAALTRAGRRFPANRDVVLANRDGRGLFFTWVTARPLLTRSLAYWRATLPQLRRAPRLFLFFTRTSARPFDVDAVVNANVLFYLGARTETRPVVAHLLSVLRANREASCDKWYENPFAVWYFFARALAGVAPEAAELMAAKLAAARPRSALDAALAACSLIAWRRAPSPEAIAALLGAQLESGGWPRAALYHGGRARLPDGSFAPPHPDTPRWGSEELTTAFAVEALAGWLALERSAAGEATTNKSSFARRYDQAIAAPRMQRLYGTSGYFNVGYWVDGATDLVAACGRLVDEVAAAVPSDAAVIVDAGCGLGTGTCRIAGKFPGALVVGANLSLSQLGAARGRGVAAPVAMDAVEMAIAGAKVDAVVAIESPLHFDTRAAFFREAHRVLRPGGVLAVADMLVEDADPIGAWMVPPANRITTPAAYQQELEEAGFVDVVVRDITELSWRPFCAAMRAVFAGHEETARAIERSVAGYVVAVARRPGSAG